MSRVELEGYLPEPPILLVKDEDTAQTVGTAIMQLIGNSDLTIAIAEKWPEHWHYEAVVITPIFVIGQPEQRKPIHADYLTKDELRFLNFYVSFRQRTRGFMPNIMECASALGVQRHKITKILLSLRAKGILCYNTPRGIQCEIGKWSLDEDKAQQLKLTGGIKWTGGKS